jgi:hypothetical protein
MSRCAWFALAREPAIVRRSLRVALVVGTLLTLINHGDRLLARDLDAMALVKILLTYAVPYCVSTWAAVQALRASAQRPD